MEVIEFRFLTTDDNSDTKYGAWSRVYEYPFVLNKLKELGANKNSLIHNTSWGYEGCHVTFKNDLDAIYDTCAHTDVRPSNLPKTLIYDITKNEPGLNNMFDFVINISTIEEVGYDNIEIIKNLFNQVKPGGYLIITFDYCNQLQCIEGQGSMNLNKVSDFIGKHIEGSNNNIINGNNSILPQNIWSHLNCGTLILRKKL
jgi:hypothetical protein